MADEITTNDLDAFFSSGGNLPDSLQQQATPATPEPAVQQAAQPVQQEVKPEAPAQPDPAYAALQAQVNQLQQYGQSLERAVADLMKGPQAKPDTPTPPDPDTDPIGHLMHQQAETAKMLKQVADRLGQNDATQAHKANLEAFVGQVKDMTAEYVKTNPEYANAYNHLRAIRTQDMRDMGVPEGQIKEMLLREELAVASRALQMGKHPAALLFDVAKRYGFVPKPPAAPTKQMENLQKGQQAAPPQIPPAGPTPDLTLEAVKGMNGEQMDKLVESDELWHKVVGGKPQGNSIFH